MARQALSGIKILDLTWVVAGPLTTKWLADHGAKVIHIESVHSPDFLRTAPPFKDKNPGLNRSAYQAYFNDNKLGLALNLKHPRAPEVLHRLVKWADVVAENFTPGVMARWGLSYEDLEKIHPGVILFSTSQQGQTGPRATVAAMGTQLVSLSGFTNLTGWPDRSPTGPFGPYTDSLVPGMGVAAIMAALIRRRRTGRGCHLDLAQLEAGLNFLATALLDLEINGRVAGRQGNKSPRFAPHGVYPCRGRDRWCAICVFSEKDWHRLCEVMGKRQLAEDPRFASKDKRKENEAALDELVSQWTKEFAADELMRKLQEAGLAAGVSSTSQDLFENNPQLAHRQFFRQLAHAEIGPHHYPAPPLRLSKTPHELVSAAPVIGEHNEYVMTEILGFSEEEFVELLLAGALE